METKVYDIVLVEDNETDAELTVRELNKHSLIHSITHIKDGAEALDFFFNKGSYAGRQDDGLPQIILLDINMPKVDGWQVLKELKANPATRQLPVMMLTASKNHPDIEKGYEMGATNYIVKPVKLEGFDYAIKALGQ